MRSVIAVMLMVSSASLLTAQDGALTLEQALERARNRGPQILAARDRIAEARGRLTGASVLFRENPQLDGALGRRTSTPGSTDFEFGVSQTFEVGGQRGARMAGARAEIDRETSSSENVARLLVADVARAYLRAVSAGDRKAIASKAFEESQTFQNAMQRRLELGDAPVLDVNLARMAAAKARAELSQAEGDAIAAYGDLKIFLGMTASEPLTVVAGLPWKQELDVASLLEGALQRPDVRILEAELRGADAEIRLGKSLRTPDVSAGFRFERDEGDNIPKATVGITLPLFVRGQEQVAVGNARANRLRRELEATRRIVEIEITSAANEYSRRKAAAEALESGAIVSLDDNEQLARRSYEEGEIGLLDLLIIRRDHYELRRIFADKKLEAAISAVEVKSRAGALR